MAGGGSEGWPTSDYMSDTRPGRSFIYAPTRKAPKEELAPLLE